MRLSQPSLLRRYFAGLAEYTFQSQLGVVDPPLLDYLSELLTEFVRSDSVFRVRSVTGQPLKEVTAMIVEAGERIGVARREVHRHIGDYTLFWTGVYPEAVERMRAESRQDHLVDYREEGKRAYWIASTIDTDEPESPSGPVLERLSRQFEMVAYGLREVRRLWETGDDCDPPRPFLIN